MERPGVDAKHMGLPPGDGPYAIDITQMVKRNNFCASQYEGIAHRTPEFRDISNPDRAVSAVIMHALTMRRRDAKHHQGDTEEE